MIDLCVGQLRMGTRPHAAMYVVLRCVYDDGPQLHSGWLIWYPALDRMTVLPALCLVTDRVIA